VAGSNIFAGTYNGIFLSTNNGANWTQVNNGLTDTTIVSFAVSGTNIFAGTNNGVYLSTNNGINWTRSNNGLPNSRVYSLTVSGTKIFAGMGTGIYLSTNDGTNWTLMNNGLGNSTVYSFAVSGSNIFAGTDGNIFLSTNNGSNWVQVKKNLPQTYVSSLAIIGSDIFAGTDMNGVWMSPISELTGISKEPNALPNVYSLSQNYPNPFNPSTTISYRLKESGFVKLNIYDIKGSLIKTLVSQTQEPGSYETQFNAKDLASGIYFYKLEVFNKGSSPVYSEIKKLVLLK
jgi:hypothetical protein